jgi:hypothetical protein
MLNLFGCNLGKMQPYILHHIVSCCLCNAIEVILQLCCCLHFGFLQLSKNSNILRVGCG